MIEDEHFSALLNSILFSFEGEVWEPGEVIERTRSLRRSTTMESLSVAFGAHIRGDHEHAERILKSMINDGRSDEQTQTITLATILLSRVLNSQARHEEALSKMDDLLTGTQGQSLHPQEALALRYQIGVTQAALQLYPESMASLTFANEAAIRVEDDYMQVLTLAEMARVNAEMGDIEKSIAIHEQLRLRGLNVPLCSDQLIGSRMSLASLLQNVGKYNDALEVYDELQSVLSLTHRKHSLLSVHLHRANTLKHLQLLDDSLDAFHEALKLAEFESEVEHKINSLIGSAEVYRMKEDFNNAKVCLRQALDQTLHTQYEELHTDAMANLASVEFAEGNVDGAIEPLFKAFERYLEIENNRSAIRIGGILVDWLAAAGRFEEAVKVQDSISEIQKSVYDSEIERAKELTSFRSRLELERETIRQRDEERTKILHAVVPQHIVDRLMSGEPRIADRLSSVTILFADVVGFSEISTSRSPEDLVHWLETLFTALDNVFSRYGCERIKTIGDSYMAISGATNETEDHTEQMTRAALEIMSGKSILPIESHNLRIGINAGPVIAGVMGGSRLSYDVWGDTVNVAARMEENSQPGRILVTESVARRLASTNEFVLEKREPLNIRGKGLMTTFWVSSDVN